MRPSPKNKNDVAKPSQGRRSTPARYSASTTAHNKRRRTRTPSPDITVSQRNNRSRSVSHPSHFTPTVAPTPRKRSKRSKEKAHAKPIAQNDLYLTQSTPSLSLWEGSNSDLSDLPEEDDIASKSRVTAPPSFATPRNSEKSTVKLRLNSSKENETPSLSLPVARRTSKRSGSKANGKLQFEETPSIMANKTSHTRQEKWSTPPHATPFTPSPTSLNTDPTPTEVKALQNAHNLAASKLTEYTVTRNHQDVEIQSLRNKLKKTQAEMVELKNTIERMEEQNLAQRSTVGMYQIGLNPMMVANEYRSINLEVSKLARSIVSSRVNREEKRLNEISQNVVIRLREEWKNGKELVLLPFHLRESAVSNSLTVNAEFSLQKVSQGNLASYITSLISKQLWSFNSSLDGPILSAIEGPIKALHHSLFDERQKQIWDGFRKELMSQWNRAAMHESLLNVSKWHAFSKLGGGKVIQELESLGFDLSASQAAGLGDKLFDLSRAVSRLWHMILAIDPQWHVYFPPPRHDLHEDPRVLVKSTMSLSDVDSGALHGELQSLVLFAMHPAIVMRSDEISPSSVIEPATVVSMDVVVARSQKRGSMSKSEGVYNASNQEPMSALRKEEEVILDSDDDTGDGSQYHSLVSSPSNMLFAKPSTTISASI
jgi:hypothetical protein